MKSGGILKHVVIAFVLALGVYALSFFLIEGARVSKGPWLVEFQSDAAGVPAVIVTQTKLKIQRVRFEFPEDRISATNLLEIVAFDRPRTQVPFGKVVFFDTTFQPGTVTLQLFGHEIEFLPRTLVLDKQEIPWKSESVYRLPRPVSNR